jgi:hypothetical protein
MAPRTITHDKRRLGNVDAVCALIVELGGDPILPATYKYYVRAEKPLSNPAPDFVIHDPDTGERMYDLDEVTEWQDRRTGSMNPGALRVGKCPVCNNPRVPVTHRELLYKHQDGDRWCAGSGEPAPAGDALTVGS